MGAEKKIETEVKHFRGLTTKAIIVGLIGILAVNFLTSHSYLVDEYWAFEGNSPPFVAEGRKIYESTGIFYNSFAFVVVFMFVVSIINHFKHVFNAQEAAIICIMVMVGGAIQNTGHGQPGVWPWIIQSDLEFAMGSMSEEDAAVFYELVPPMLRPADPEYTRYIMTTSWASPNIAMFGLNLLWGTAFLTFSVFSIYFLLLLFRRLWVDIEYLDFPIGNFTSNLVDLTQPSSPAVKLFKAKYFWIGFAIQFVWLLIEVGPNVIVNWAESSPAYVLQRWPAGDIPGTGITIMPRWDLGAYALIWSTLFISVEPWRIGWTSLLSLDVLLGFLVGWLALWIIYPLALGPIWGPVPVRSGWSFFTRVGGYYYPKNVSPSAGLIGTVMMLSLFVLSLVRNRKTIGPILLGLFKEPPKELDPEAPMSYRVTWICFLVSFIATLGTVAALGADVAYFALWWVIWLIFLVAFARLNAETGSHLGSATMFRWYGWWFFVDAFFLGVLGSAYWYSGLNKATLLTHYLTAFSVGGGLAAGLFTFYNYMASFTSDVWRVGKRTRTSVRDVVLATLIAVFIGVLSQGAFRYMWMHIMPLAEWVHKGVGFSYPSSSFSQLTSLLKEKFIMPWFTYQITEAYTTNPVDFWVKIIIAAALPFILYALRKRWAKFRISTAGIAMGALFGPNFWSAAVVAIIVRYITLKVGGPDLYKNKVIPTATGFLCGMLIIYLIFVMIANPLWTWQHEPVPF